MMRYSLQILALDKRLGGLGEDSPVWRAFLDVRHKMFLLNVQLVAASLPAEVTDAFPDLPQQLTVLGLAITDGLYVHANSAVPLDFTEYAEVACRALEAMVDQYAKRAPAAVPANPPRAQASTVWAAGPAAARRNCRTRWSASRTAKATIINVGCACPDVTKVELLAT